MMACVCWCVSRATPVCAVAWLVVAAVTDRTALMRTVAMAFIGGPWCQRSGSSVGTEPSSEREGHRPQQVTLPLPFGGLEHRCPGSAGEEIAAYGFGEKCSG